MLWPSKDKRFAAGANRAVVENGSKILGSELNALITDAIMGMREVDCQIGLQGSEAAVDSTTYPS